MPKLSLVVCLHKERDQFLRLIDEAADCYDDLVVVHDGSDLDTSSPPISVEAPPKMMAIDYSALTSDASIPPFYNAPPLPRSTGNIHALVLQYGGRYFEGPRCFQQEPHWPFAWWQAKHDWILRLDADEFPSEELEEWLRRFRESPEPEKVSGYTCLWPLWNGKRAVTGRWPSGRIFLLNRQRVRFFGMVEQVPIPDTSYQALDLVLHHRPKRKSYGVRNVVFRRQAYNWRSVIAQSLIRRPNDLPCWRWQSDEWPEFWRNVRENPLRHSIKSLIQFPIHQFRGMVAAGQKPLLSECLNPALHHFMLGLRVSAEKQDST